MDSDSPSAAYNEPDNSDIDGGQMGVHSQQHHSGVDDMDDDFEPDPNMETLDLSGQYIDDLEPLIKLVF